MGWREKIGKLLAGETVSLKISPSVGGAGNRLTAETDSYVGQWRGANSALRIKADGTIDYRRQETGATRPTPRRSSGPIDSFDGSSFLVGVLGKNRRFEVTEPPHEGADGSIS